VGSRKSLCPGGSPCKYKGGGIDWNWEANCNDVVYENIRCERNRLEPSVFNQASKDACMDALVDMKDMVVNVCFDKNSRPINLKDKPPGVLYHLQRQWEDDWAIQRKRLDSIKNKWNGAEPLCVNPSWTQSSIPTAVPNGCADDSDFDGSDTCTRDRCSKK